jgi:hypothetical protein
MHAAIELAGRNSQIQFASNPIFGPRTSKTMQTIELNAKKKKRICKWHKMKSLPKLNRVDPT